MEVYTTRQARTDQSKLIKQVKAGDHPLVTFRGEDFMRWVDVDWYDRAEHAMRVVAGLETMSHMLKWGDPDELREIGAALQALASATAGQGRGPHGPAGVQAVS